MTLWTHCWAKWKWPFYSCCLYDRDKQVVNTEMTLLEGWEDTPLKRNKCTQYSHINCWKSYRIKKKIDAKTKSKKSTEFIHSGIYSYTSIYSGSTVVYAHTLAMDQSMHTLITLWFTEAAGTVNRGMDFCFHKTQRIYSPYKGKSMCESNRTFLSNIKTDKVVIQAYFKLQNIIDELLSLILGLKILPQIYF